MFGMHLSKSLNDTKKLAVQIAQEKPIGKIIALIGDLGTGKTAFAQSFASAIGVEEAVGSPTFKLISEYQGAEVKLYHIDCYRLKNAQQFLNIGGEDYLSPKNAITIIEWADIIEEILPSNKILINFKRIPSNPDYREITIK